MWQDNRAGPFINQTHVVYTYSRLSLPHGIALRISCLSWFTLALPAGFWTFCSSMGHIHHGSRIIYTQGEEKHISQRKTISIILDKGLIYHYFWLGAQLTEGFHLITSWALQNLSLHFESFMAKGNKCPFDNLQVRTPKYMYNIIIVFWLVG